MSSDLQAVLSLESLNVALTPGEPRVRDLDLARALRFTDLHKIRELILRHIEELARYGGVSATAAETSPKGGRPGMEYWLNEGQAVLITMFSKTERAADIRQQIIQVFMDWRRGQTTPARAPERRDFGPRAQRSLDLPDMDSSFINQIRHWQAIRDGAEARLASFEEWLGMKL